MSESVFIIRLIYNLFFGFFFIGAAIFCMAAAVLGIATPPWVVWIAIGFVCLDQLGDVSSGLKKLEKDMWGRDV